MYNATTASDEKLPGNGATPGRDSQTPIKRTANEKDARKVDGPPSQSTPTTPPALATPKLLIIGDVDAFARKPSIKRTPTENVMEQTTCDELRADKTPVSRGVQNKDIVSPSQAFLRSLVSNTSDSAGAVTTEEAIGCDSVFVEDEDDEGLDDSSMNPFQLAKKRKRNKGSSPEIRLLHEIEPSSSIALLNEQVLELIEFARKNTNVHKQIKNMSRKLRATAEKIALDYKKAEYARREIERNSTAKESLFKKEIEELKKASAERKEQNLSRENIYCSLCRKQVNDNVDLNRADPEDLNSFRQYVTKPWPEGLFTRTRIVEKDKIGRIPDHVAVLSDSLFTDQKKGHTAKGNRLEIDILDQFPEIDTEPPIECPGGFSITLEEMSSFRIKATNKNIEKRRTVSVMLRRDDQGDNVEKVHGLLLELKKVLLEAKTNIATIVAPTYINCKIMQKIVECVFRDVLIEIEIIVAKGALGSYAKATRGRERPDRGEALIIEASESRGYNSLLGTLREKLNASTAAGIKSVKKTANGNLLLQIRGEAKAEELRGRVKEALGTDNIRMADGLPRKTLFIRGIDGMAETKEIRDALFAACTLDHADQVKLTVNKNARDEQSAVITLIAGDAEKLLSMRKIRVGFSDCYVQERIKVDRCFKCWQFGHSARTCPNAGINMSDCCFKCGQAGHHKAKCASEKDFCPSCGIEGHQSGTGKCIAFRRALGREKKRRKASVTSVFAGTTANHEQH